jgi:N-acylneuraminate cytidylyltransferase
MVTPDKVLAVVPARGRSKSIPGKNIKLLGGHPLIAYSVAAGLQAGRVGRVIVSTDDPEIARIAKALGAEVPFLRPAALAGDSVTDLPVFQHALEALDQAGNARPEIVVQLRPTSPFRPPGAVDEAVRMLAEVPEADSVRSVAPPGQNPYKMWRVRDGRLEPLLKVRTPEPYNAPRQSLPEVLWQTGQIDAAWRSTIVEKGSMSGERILPLVMDPALAVDLDTPAQWESAERLLRSLDHAIVRPADVRPPLTRRIRLVVSDFDGVHTDNRVWLSQDGRESVICNREDWLGVARLQAAGIPFVIVSTEGNPVVGERARKLKARCFQRVRNKGEALIKIAAEYGVMLNEVAYVGNDVNDLEALQAAGLAVAVADARPEALEEADLVLERAGGRGAVRELCDLILAKSGKEVP